MAFTRITNKDLSPTILRGRNANIEISGLAYGDSSLFIADRNRPAIYKWSGDTWVSPISRRNLRDAARDAALKFGDNFSAARANMRVGSVAFIGDSKLVVGDTGNGYLLYFNHVSRTGDTSRYEKLPTNFVPVGLAHSGDSKPWIYDKNSKSVKEWRLVSHPAQYRTESYNTTTYTTVTIPGERRTEYRVTGEVGTGASGDVFYSCSDKESGSSRYFTKNRTRYNRQNTWDTDRNTAISRARRNESVRTRSNQTSCGPPEASGWCPAGTCQKTTSTTRTTTTTECRYTDYDRGIQTCTTRTTTTQDTTNVSATFYVRPPTNKITTYNPVIQTRQIDTTRRTTRARTVTRQRTVLVRSAYSQYEWADRIPNSVLNAAIGDSLLNDVGGLTRDDIGGTYLATSPKAYYFFDNRRSTIDSRHDLNYGDYINPQGIVWDGEGLFVSNTASDRLQYYKREDIIVRFRSNPSLINITIEQPPLPPWIRDGDTKDIDLINDIGFTNAVIPSGLAHDGTSLYFSDRNSNRVFKINPITKAASSLISSASIGGQVDSLTFGDSLLWVGNDRDQTLIPFNSNGIKQTRPNTNLPEGTIPTGIAHKGDTGGLPYVVDFVNDKIISYEERKEVTPPLFGDSVIDQYYYETYNELTPRTRYRVVGDTENTISYTSCSSEGDSGWYSTTRYRNSDQLFNTREQAKDTSSFFYTYKSICRERVIPYSYDSQTTTTTSKQVQTQAARTEYRVSGERVSGSGRFSCGNRSGTTFRATRVRYNSTGWYSSSAAAITAGRRNEAVSASGQNSCGSGDCRSGTCTSTQRVARTRRVPYTVRVSKYVTRYRNETYWTTEYYTGQVCGYVTDWSSYPPRSEYRCRTTQQSRTVQRTRRVPYQALTFTTETRYRTETYYVNQNITLDNYVNIPGNYDTYTPIVSSRNVPAQFRTTLTNKVVTVRRSGQRTYVNREVRTWSPVYQEIGDTVVVTKTRQLTRQIPTKVLRVAGDSKLVTKWGTKLGDTLLRGINPGIRPTGLTFGPQNNLFLLDSDKDSVYFFFKGEERREIDGNYDLSQGVLRSADFNIFPAAVAWNHQDGFYISDVYNKKIWYFRFNPRIQLRWKSERSSWNIKPRVAPFIWTSGKSSWDIKNIRRIIFSKIQFTSGDTSSYNIRVSELPPPRFSFVSGDSSSWNINLHAATASNISFGFRSGDSSIFRINGTLEKFIQLNFESAQGTFNIIPNRNIHPKILFTSGNSTLTIRPKKIETLPRVQFTSGDSSSFSINAEIKDSIEFPFSFSSGDSSKFSINPIEAHILHPDTVDFTSGRSAFNIGVTKLVPVVDYVSFGFYSHGGRIDVKAIEQVPAPQLTADFGRPINIQGSWNTVPSGRHQLLKYNAVGFYEYRVSRTLPPRPRTGDTFSEFVFSFPEVTREPTQLGPATPQLLPPTITARQQGREVILHWNEQAELYITKAQLQVSQQIEGPYFAVDKSTSEEFMTGDSGGATDTEGFEEVLPNIPLRGTAGVPEPRTLYYRARRIDNDGDVSDWSSPAPVTVKPIETKEIGGRTVTVEKLGDNLYGELGVGNNLAYWSMDDTVDNDTPFELGTLQDSSQDGGANPLRITGDKILGVPGRSSRGLFIDGLNNTSYAITNRVGDTGDSWNALSMMGFIKGGTQQYQNEIGILSYWGDTSNYINISFIRRTRIFRLRIGDTNVLNSNPLHLFNNQWRQVGFTYNAVTKEAKLWLDGSPIITQTITTNKTSIPQGGYFGVGGLAGNNFVGYKMRGIIDEVRVWNRVITVEEFGYFRNNPKGTSATPVSGSQAIKGTFTADVFKGGFLEAGAAGVKSEIKVSPKTGFGVGDSAYSTGDFQSHFDNDELLFQKFGDSRWETQGSFTQNANGCFINLTGDTKNTQISPGSIIYSDSKNRILQSNTDVNIQKLINNVWITKTRISENDISIYNDSGTLINSLGRGRLNLNDRIVFSNTYSIVKHILENRLDFGGEIKATAYVPNQRFFNQSITQSALFGYLSNAGNTQININGFGKLDSAIGGNNIFVGQLIYAEKQNSSLYHINGWNTSTDESQTLVVNSGMNVNVFDKVTMTF